MQNGAVPQRLPGVVGAAFILGAFIFVSSVEEAHGMWTSERMREVIEQNVDALVTKLSGNTIPAAAQPQVDGLKREFVESSLRRRPLREALSLTNAVVGALVAYASTLAMRLRLRGQSWLIQAAATSIAFTLVQIGTGAVMGLEQASILSRYAPAIFAAAEPGQGLGAMPDMNPFRFVTLIPPALVGGCKIAFFGYLIRVLRRPKVQALFR